MGILFNDIYSNYVNNVYKLCYYKTGNKDEAEDLTQEIFLKAYKSLNKFKGTSSPYTWLYTIAVRTCIDYKVKTLKDKTELNLNETIKDSLTLEDDHLKKNRNLVIKSKIDNLDDKYRMVIYLFYYEEMKIKDISIVLKERENTIKTWLKRGKEKLKKELCKEGINYE